MDALGPRLKHFASVERPDTRRDAMGGQVDQWVKLGDLWISLDPAGSKERWEASKVEADISHVSSARWRDDVTPECRIRIETPRGPRLFQITGCFNRGEANYELVMWLNESIGGTNASS